MTFVLKLLISIIVLAVSNANAATSYKAPKASDQNAYFFITNDSQYIEVSDGKLWDGFYKDKTVHLDESYGWKVEYTSPADEIEIVETVELSGPAEWGLSPLDENNSVGILSYSPEILEQGRILKTRTVWKNTGVAFGAYTVIQGDPEGEAKITLRINDRVVRVYKWHVVPKRRVIPLQ